MELLLNFFRFVYRIKWWLVILPSLVTIFVVYLTRDLTRSYEVSTSLYMGVLSGFDVQPESSSGKLDLGTLNNAMDNMTNILTAKSTLRRVSMRLFAQHMMKGDPNHDNNYITAKNFRALLQITPKEVLALIDKNSEENTLRNLYAYDKQDVKNFVYGLFNWSHRHYSYTALSRITVNRLGTSDILQIRYSNDDPGIAFNTLALLNEEFVKQYEELRYGESNSVIAFYENELVKASQRLRETEDSLTTYNIEKKVINYEEQTTNVAAMSRDYQSQYGTVRLKFNSARSAAAMMDQRIGQNIELLKNNAQYLSKIRNISDLNAQLSRAEIFQSDPDATQTAKVAGLRQQLKVAEEDFKNFSGNFAAARYSKESYPSADLLEQWLTAVLDLEEAKAEMAVMEDWGKELDEKYVFYSPVGSTLKRKERMVNFTEQSYLAILQSLNTARMQQKGLQMSSATLRVINPPTYPLEAVRTKRRIMVLGAFVGSFVFIFGFFLLLELLDRTLRDRLRTERITSGKVIAAYPGRSRLRYRNYHDICSSLAIKYIGNSLLPYFSSSRPVVINFLSTEPQEGRSYIAEHLAGYWQSIGMSVRVVSDHSDFSALTKEYMLAQSVRDLCPGVTEDVLLVDHPSLRVSAVPTSLLQEACINVLVTSANRVWTDTDRMQFERLKSQSGATPLYLLLNQAERSVVEDFTGLLPPYTRFRKWAYRWYQLGITSQSIVTLD